MAEYYLAVMAAKTANIAITDELAAFARSDMMARGFGNFSEYVRDLLRHRRQQRIEEDLAFISKAMKGAPVSEPPAEMMRDLSRLRRSTRRRQ